MDLEFFREYCLSKPFTSEELPFDEDTLVYKVCGKIFAITGFSNINPFNFNIKCEPEWAIELREKYNAIQPGYHMNKKHWNTVSVDGSIDKELLLKMIDHSFDLVVAKLKKNEREQVAGAM